MSRIRRKWRPSLALVIGGTLAAVLLAPMVGLVVVKLLWGYMRYRYAVMLVGAGVLLVTVILGWLLWRLILKPVQRLSMESKAFAAGEVARFDPQAHYGTRELRELGQSVLDMAESLHNRQETVRTYTSHVTHELKSPLTALIGAAELLEAEGLSGEQRAQLLGTVRQSADRMQDLLEGLRQMAKAREPLGQGASTLDQVLADLAGEYPALKLQVTGGDLSLPIPPEGLVVILRQMLGNAAAHGADQVWLEAMPEALVIRDNGSGISAGNRKRLFEPFFTTRREEGGTGMGLAIVRSLLMVRGAGIAVLDSEKGAAFRIDF